MDRAVLERIKRPAGQYAANQELVCVLRLPDGSALEVHSPANGLLVGFAATAGQELRAGQTLFELQPTHLSQALPLPPLDGLRLLQRYSDQMCRMRGWVGNPASELFLLLSEEVGELAKAIRNREGIYLQSGRDVPPDELEKEMADVLSYLLHLANHFGIDLAEAFAKKERLNADRAWK